MNEQKNSISLKQERCENFSALNKDELLVRYQDQMSLIEELESTVNSGKCNYYTAANMFVIDNIFQSAAN